LRTPLILHFLERRLPSEIAGVDTAVDPTVTIRLPGGDILPFTKESYTSEAVWTGYVDIPETAPSGPCEIKVTGAADLAGNGMQSPVYQILNASNPLLVNDGAGGRSQLAIEVDSSYVSPAYVKGLKPEAEADVLWRYVTADEDDPDKITGTWGGWQSVSDGADGGTGACADDWWWTEIDLDVLEKPADLTPEDRMVFIQSAVKDVFGRMHEQDRPRKIEWIMTRDDQERHFLVVPALVC
jgi:hypothetical protein